MNVFCAATDCVTLIMVICHMHKWPEGFLATFISLPRIGDAYIVHTLEIYFRNQYSDDFVFLKG